CPTHERRCQGPGAPEQGALQRAHGDQSVLSPRAHVRQLGADEAGGAREEGVDRRDEARRSVDRAHPLSRRASQPAGPGQAHDRRGRPRSAEGRPQARARGAAGPSGGNCALRERQGLHLARALRGHPRVGGGAHRLARDPARPGRPHGAAELAAVERREPKLDRLPQGSVSRMHPRAGKLETWACVLLTKVLMEVEQLLRRELRAKLPLAQQVLLYLDPFAFFKDASRGTAMVRERNLSYNRGMRWVLVPYLRRWLLIAAGLFLAIAPAEGMA